MTALANLGNVEEEALVAYIVGGIGEKGPEAYLLYGANTIDELKQAIRTYEKVKNRSSLINENRRSENRTNSNARGVSGNRATGDYKPSRCYICGDKKHSSDVCSNKSKGFKCFRCNQYGHKALNCNIPKTQHPNFNKAETNFIAVDKTLLTLRLITSRVSHC